MSASEASAEVRRRARNGDPPFRPGDLVLIHMWHASCWPHTVSEPYMGRVTDLDTVDRTHEGYGVGSGNEFRLGVRIEGTSWIAEQEAKTGNPFGRYFCGHIEHWTLVKGAQ